MGVNGVVEAERARERERETECRKVERSGGRP